MRFFRAVQYGMCSQFRETGPVYKRPVRFHTLKEGRGIERIVPKRRAPHAAPAEGKLELTEVLRSNDRS
jgi:hypothetical protein